MNQYKGEVKGKLGDKERTFRLTFESIVNIEDKTGKSITRWWCKKYDIIS